MNQKHIQQFIPPNIIKDILDQTNIIDIINDRIKIKKIGKNYYALCPFHSENTPSFTINNEKQYFYCFGCNAHGNIIDFLMQYDHMSFIESVHTLANITGVQVNNNKKKTNIYSTKQQLYYTTEIVKKLYYKNINCKYSKEAQCYLKSRNITLKTINEFNIGFSHNQYFLLKNITNQTYINNLIYLGIIIKKNNQCQYDRFYNKIIFPIKNHHGKITGFGGRNLNNNTPKYTNSPQSIIFNKSYQLYGIEKVQIKKKNYILVVEGYFDVISLTQFNIHNTVAILGTNITKYQINILLKISNHIIFCYDGDVAGEQASYRTMQIMLSYMHDKNNVQFIFLPNGEDPNSIIYKEGTKKFQERIKNATNMIHYFCQKIMYNINLKSLQEVSNMLNIAIPLIQRIPSAYIRMYLKKKIGQKIGIFDEIELKKIFYKKKLYIIPNTLQTSNFRILVSLIIQNPKLNNILPFKINELKKININGVSVFLNIYYLCKKYHYINTGQIIEFYRNKNIFYIIKKLAHWNNLIEQSKINHVFLNLIKKIYHIALEKKYKKLIIKDRLTDLNRNEKHILWKINKTLSK